eukprot:CAMPEP_0168611494 /NCGR_PEP_ID=MMETSP0449_2-20121227/2390_1 /TAXON_ID=1082188 /ORGANISM="Strombidium rassoulzadegani, Strain ras09" /LENGTH=243 /DNA_ID=CAMNT_0008651949 /DNA_START=1125 /DNA_END=1856 /DNA_ORIENTATION=+
MHLHLLHQLLLRVDLAGALAVGGEALVVGERVDRYRLGVLEAEAEKAAGPGPATELLVHVDLGVGSSAPLLPAQTAAADEVAAVAQVAGSGAGGVAGLALIPNLHVGVDQLLQRVVGVEVLVGRLHTSHYPLDLPSQREHRLSELVHHLLLVVDRDLALGEAVVGIVLEHHQLALDLDLHIVVRVGLGVEPQLPLLLPTVLYHLCSVRLVVAEVEYALFVGDDWPLLYLDLHLPLLLGSRLIN